VIIVVIIKNIQMKQILIMSSHTTIDW